MVILLSVFVISTFTIDAYGHGLGAETFPPVDLDGKSVTLEVSSSNNTPEENDELQISISLIDFNSKNHLTRCNVLN